MLRPGNDTRVESPCVNVCLMDDDSGYCTGCKRTLDEIGGWLNYSDTERMAVLETLPTREVAAVELD